MDKFNTSSLSVTCALRQPKSKSGRMQDLATQEAAIFDEISRLIKVIHVVQSKFTGQRNLS